MRIQLILLFLFTTHQLIANEVVPGDSLPHLYVHEMIGKDSNIYTYHLAIDDRDNDLMDAIFGKLGAEKRVGEFKLRVSLPKDAVLLTDINHYKGWQFDTSAQQLTITIEVDLNWIAVPIYLDMYSNRQLQASEMQLQILSPNASIRQKKRGYDWTQRLSAPIELEYYCFTVNKDRLLLHYQYNNKYPVGCDDKGKRTTPKTIRLAFLDDDGKVLERISVPEQVNCEVRNLLIKVYPKQARYIFVGNGPYRSHYLFDLLSLEKKCRF
jgi:putative NIF3 family GTP cyclohydrolase 1 type 2